VFLLLDKIMPFEILASLEGVNPDWTSLTLRSIGFLMLLALVAFGVTRLGKGWGKDKLTGLKADGKIILSDCRPLGNRQFIIVAQYGMQKHLLGVSPGKIEHLTKLEETAQVESPDQPK
jgi:flagellar biogenesis protein FliO